VELEKENRVEIIPVVEPQLERMNQCDADFWEWSGVEGLVEPSIDHRAALACFEPKLIPYSASP
jgi:hypothetical protein